MYLIFALFLRINLSSFYATFLSNVCYPIQGQEGLLGDKGPVGHPGSTVSFFILFPVAKPARLFRPAMLLCTFHLQLLFKDLNI